MTSRSERSLIVSRLYSVLTRAVSSSSGRSPLLELVGTQRPSGSPSGNS
jgi:hypothetical protein